MAEQKIRFDDGAGYERFMGVWSRLAGEVFLDWLAPPAGLRWIDIGCGNGSFTELLVERCAPFEIHGIDPSEAQLAFAADAAGCADRTILREGSAMALPFSDNRFDAAVMALVIFLPARAGTRRRGDGASGWPGRDGRGLRTGHRRGRGSPRAAERRATSGGHHAADGAERRRVADRSPAGFMGRSRDRGHRNAADYRVADLCRFRRPVGRHPVRADLWLDHSLPWKPGMPSGSKGTLEARLPPDAAGRITYAASANAIKGRVPN